ncbi:MAG: hypothetical protein R3301_16705 [Saprospiraceae bacterium]|nr:hypothetical protein [Saprospiraceae bacterium]
MRIVINLLLFALIIGLGYLMYANIKEPIAFKAEKEKRERAVVDKLKKIRTAQEHYRSITGSFANSFDSLAHVLKTGQFMVINVQGDPDDPNFDPSMITYDTVYFPAFDSIRSLGINVDSLPYVPYGEGATFDIQADTLTYQKTLVNVVEVGVLRKVFMGDYADARFSKYDNGYNPNSRIKFGDMNTPNTAGNWER